MIADLRAAAPGVEVAAVRAHGQTVRHRPELGYTIQLIDGARLAERGGLPVVCDFRTAGTSSAARPHGPKKSPASCCCS